MLRRWLRPHFLLLFMISVVGLCAGQGAMAEAEQRLLSDAGATKSERSVEPPRAGDPMNELLHWAIKHSDPEKLKELMRKYEEHNLTLKDVYGEDLLDSMFVDEGSEMLALIGQIQDFKNATVDDHSLELALERLQEFVEQIDNAGNLHRMGGLEPLLDLGLCPERSSSTRALAMWTLGVAMQNNPPVQEDFLTLNGLTRLAAELPRCSAGASGADAQYCGKLMFTMSALVKNSDTIQAAASAAGVFDWMLEEGTSHPATSVVKKCMGVLDTVLAQNPQLPFLKVSGPRARLAQTLLSHTGGEGSKEVDMDIAEKSLRLINRILSLRPMLFPGGFQSELEVAAARTMRSCEASFGVGDEICTGFKNMVDNAALMLTARDVADDEL